MLLQSPEDIKERAQKIASRLKKGVARILDDVAEINVIEDSSQAGGGSLPEIEFKTYAVGVNPLRISVNTLEERLRHGNPPIIARIKNDALIIDARTVRNSEINALVKGIVNAL
jgi:L-seryl-tRNA(Ser) seleniumtransferase